MKESRLVEDTKHCLFCGSPYVEEHHVYFGQRREAADRYKLTVPLCGEHHMNLCQYIGHKKLNFFMQPE